MKISGTIFIASLMVMLVAGGSASAEDKDIIRLQSDVVNLQGTIKLLQESVDAKNAVIASQVAKMADQMNNITVSLQKMSDQVTAMTAANSAANTALLAGLGKGVADTQAVVMPALTELKRGIDDLKQGQQTQAKALSDQLITLKSGSEALPTCKDLKQVADRSANSGYWDDAVSGYRDFLSNPACATDPKVSEVQFDIAESYFGWKKFDLSVQEYDIFLQKYPPNDKTASALLRKGLAHAELKQTTDARAALTRVTKEFPGTGEAANAAAKLKELGTAPAPAAAGRGARGQ
jgi:TolA-binding protein